jgi:glycosyltransferase involved in cell wall biosynthesis
MKKTLAEKIPFSIKLWLKKKRKRFSNRAEDDFPIVARRDDEKSSIIVFNDTLPHFDRDSGGLRLFQILRVLAENRRVVFIPVGDSRHELFYENKLAEINVEIRSVLEYDALLKSENFAAAILSRPDVADKVFDSIRRLSPETKIIYDTVDIHFVRFEREFEIVGKAEFRRAARRFKQLEAKLAASADQVWCVTDADRKFLQPLTPAADFEIVPNIHESGTRGANFAQRDGLLFVGNYQHRPNVDAVLFFLDAIFPRLLQGKPDLKFYVVGADPPPEILRRKSETVVVSGFVPEVEPYFERARVFVAPLRYGAGMKGKIGQALSFGLPVVTTAVGAEGMNLQNECDVLIADEPEAFADSVRRVYDDNLLWQKLSDAGFNRIADYFSPAVVAEKVRQAVSRVNNKK